MNEQNDNRRLPFRARAYGLEIWSDLELPEFLPGAGSMDVAVVLEEESCGPDCTRPQWELGSTMAECRFPGVGRFRITAGSEIRVTPTRGVAPGLIRLYVEGMMMAILLHQRGHFVLHASMVEIHGKGIGFVGPVGAGKSSMAMALHSLGGRVVTDDNAAVRIEGGVPVVVPAFPRVKLYPDIATALGIERKSLDDLHQSQVKKTKSVAGGFVETPVRLHRIYALSREVSTIEKLSRPEASVELIKHSIPTRWGLAGTADQLRKCAQFTGIVPIYRVRTFDRPAAVADVARNIESHFLSPLRGNPEMASGTVVAHAG